MRTALLSLTFLLAGSMAAPAFAHTAAPKKKVTATTKKGKILPMKEYIDQLMAKMTLQEKIGQLNLMVAGDITTGGALDTQVGNDIAQGNMGGVFNIKGLDKIKALQEIAIKNSRLGIPLLVGMDVIHGYETMFPIPLALSCSWDTEAMKKVGEVSAKEASADGINWTFSPMVDIALDARWGRISEGNGEDPYLSGVMGAAMTQGYQGVDMRTEEILRANRIMACLKHFALYGGVESGKEYNTVDMSRVRMMNQYLPPYEAVVKAGVGSVMSSFNLIDYTPATANKWMMTDVLRKQWGFNGFVVTDYASIAEILQHGTAKDIKEASEQALKAGTDMDMCSNAFVKHLAKSIAEGKVSEEDVNIACRRILEAKYKLGLFSDPYRYCNTKRSKSEIYTAENRQAARDVAAETFVLLKNEGNILPLKKEGKIALIGPLADTRNNIAGTWSVAQVPSKYTTIKEAMEHALAGKATLLYAQGSNIWRNQELQQNGECGKPINWGNEAEMKTEALKIAKEADVIVCAMGESAEMSGECGSRTNLEMPDVQRELLAELLKTGKPIVLLNFAGRPTVLTWEKAHVPAIMNVWFGGSEMGDALCDVIFGDKSPSGKLTTSMPKTTGQEPLYYNHQNTGRPVPDDNEKFAKFASNCLDVSNGPLYPFGYGLSYTYFSYSNFRLSSQEAGISNEEATEWQDGKKITASVTVKNNGSRDADEIVQLYIRDMVASISRPVKELKGFQRIHLAVGESKEVSFDITPDMLKFYNADLKHVIEPGDFQIMIGTNSKDVKTMKLNVK
ncbi:beta-glucosidase BglX [Segatella sp.]|uniref:beta-glucosidase BglX n=1 Tax=Segatella sp. TaxID=2974253 RepID=UPI00307A909B